MPQSMQGEPRHLKAFWPIFIILVIAVVAGLLVYWFQFQLTNDQETQTVSLSVHKRASVKKMPIKKMIPATSVKK